MLGKPWIAGGLLSSIAGGATLGLRMCIKRAPLPSFVGEASRRRLNMSINFGSKARSIPRDAGKRTEEPGKTGRTTMPSGEMSASKAWQIWRPTRRVILCRCNGSDLEGCLLTTGLCSRHWQRDLYICDSVTEKPFFVSVYDND